MLKTEKAIAQIKDFFAKELSRVLNLTYVSSPLIVLDGTGINDDLNGVERPVKFPVKGLNDREAVVVHSLAKWKRLRLKELLVGLNEGILTDMRALRPDEDYTPIHSIYVDQWDWEIRMDPSDRTLDYLTSTVRKIYEVFKLTEKEALSIYPELEPVLPDDITFIHAEELLNRYPSMSVKERENAIAKEYGAVFIIGIGGELSDGTPHDGRAPDYDDWSTENESGYQGLNGDIVLYNPVLKSAFEVSSMGIRVDKESLMNQLKIKGAEDRTELTFHNLLLSGHLPQSIGGGIGQSRVCMFMLKKSHIGEVQVSVWPEEERQRLASEGVYLL